MATLSEIARQPRGASRSWYDLPPEIQADMVGLEQPFFDPVDVIAGPLSAARKVGVKALAGMPLDALAGIVGDRTLEASRNTPLADLAALAASVSTGYAGGKLADLAMDPRLRAAAMRPLMNQHGAIGDAQEEKLRRIMEKLGEKYSYVGLRTADGPPVGEYSRSYVWDDGNMTDDALPGISITSSDEREIYPYHLGKGRFESGKYVGSYYPGKDTYLVGSDNLYEYGQDQGELIVEPEFIRRIFRHEK